jgi:hypothetical protein
MEAESGRDGHDERPDRTGARSSPTTGTHSGHPGQRSASKILGSNLPFRDITKETCRPDKSRVGRTHAGAIRATAGFLDQHGDVLPTPGKPPKWDTAGPFWPSTSTAFSWPAILTMAI